MLLPNVIYIHYIYYIDFLYKTEIFLLRTCILLCISYNLHHRIFIYNTLYLEFCC